MQLPMVGSWTVNVAQVTPFTIHGDLYYELRVARAEEPGKLLAVKIPRHACKSEPVAGTKLVLTFLMGQITDAKLAE